MQASESSSSNAADPDDGSGEVPGAEVPGNDDAESTDDHSPEAGSPGTLQDLVADATTSDEHGDGSA